MFSIFAPASFDSLWYWVLTAVVWSVVCNRVLGVPYDMLWRARRDARIAARAADLAETTAERVSLLYDRAGVPVAALAGFGLAVLFAVGFGYGSEFAIATFCLLFPLTLVAYSTLRLALAVRRRRPEAATLLRVVARRRLWHQIFAMIAIFCTVAAAYIRHPPY